MNAQKTERLLFAILLIALLDSAYLLLVAIAPQTLACPDAGIINCASVVESVFSKVFGVPLALLGFVWVIAAIALTYYMRDKIQTTLWFAAGIVGVAYSFTAMYSLREICVYCSALDILVIASMALLYKVQQHK